MPNRIIKESYKASPEIDELTWFEECVWNRLVVTVDDFGRYDGRIVVLKNELFPTKEDVTKADVESALAKLSAVGLIVTYTVDGRPYIMLKTWEKHQQIRAKKSKYPSPEEGDITCNQMISNDIKCPRNPIQSSPIQLESNSFIVTEKPKPQSQRMKRPTVDEIQSYILGKGYSVDAEKFFDYYESNGWKVGKNPMKDWKACVRTWQKNNTSKPTNRVRIETPDWYKKQQTQGFTEQTASEDLQKQFEEMKKGFEQK